MAQKQISRFPQNEKFSGLSGHVPNYVNYTNKSCLYRVVITELVSSLHHFADNPSCIYEMVVANSRYRQYMWSSLPPSMAENILIDILNDSLGICGHTVRKVLADFAVCDELV